MKLLLITIVLGSVFFTGCKKDDIASKSKTELITARPWILKAYTSTRLSDGTTTDAFAPMSDCYKDDQYVFKADNTYEGNAGATKCSATDPQIFQTGTWRFTTNETKLERTITSGSGIGTYEFKVVSITQAELKISVEDGTYNHQLTYSH